MYCRTSRIRHFDSKAEALLAAGEIPRGHAHLSRPRGHGSRGLYGDYGRDYMLGTHRSHGHPIAKGAKLEPRMAELLGKVTGTSPISMRRIGAILGCRPTSRGNMWAAVRRETRIHDAKGAV
jgi:TPP-dependent pyruvate/acetoin dehydrogenase alpha subunit